MPLYLIIWIQDRKAIMEHWNPPEDKLQKEIDAYRGSYVEQIEYREKMWSSEKSVPVDGWKRYYWLSFLIDFFSRSFAMMLVGMACFSWGFLATRYQKIFTVV